MKFQLRSPAFASDGFIPDCYTSVGASISPPLNWSNAPQSTQEYALICEDPDAPFPQAFVHWILYGLSASTLAIPAGLPADEWLDAPVEAKQGLNSLFQLGYTGPNPPAWHHAHRYIFRLFALDQALELAPGAGRTAFHHAIQGRVLAEAKLVGFYEKRTAQRIRAGLQLIAGLGATTAAVALVMKGRVANESPPSD